MNKRIGLVIAGVAAASVLAGGAAYGAVSSIPDSAGVVHGCYDSGGNLKVIDTSVTATCPKGFTSLNWNQTGPAGQNGTNGTNGSSVVTSAGVPSSACNPGDTDVDLATGEVYTCVTGGGTGGTDGSGAGAGKAGPPGNAWSDTGSSIMGPQGPGGPGYVFTTTSGIAPPLTRDGTYYVDVQAELTDPSSTDPLIGSCNIFDVAHQASGFAGAFALPPGGTAQTYSVSGIVTVTGGTSSTNFAQMNLGCEDSAGNTVTPGAVTWWVSPVGTSG